MSPPNLQGTYRQIAWAESIRNQALKDFDKILSMLPDFEPEVRESVANLVDMWQSQESASWWIESRDMDFNDWKELALRYA